MKKIILLSILSLNIYATEYKIEINKANYDNAVSVEDYVDPSLTCESPEVLNEEKTGCINPIPTCTFPEVLNSTNDACINTFEKVGWIDRTDNCQGIRPMSNNANVLVLRSKTSNRNDNPQIPEGYRWITHEEYTSLVIHNGTYWNYYGHCGHSGYPANPSTQIEISFSNTRSTGIGTHSGWKEGYKGIMDQPVGWFGIAVVRDN